MKNIVISKNNNGDGDENVTIGEKIQYFHNLVQKTLLSIQKYKQQDVLGANELNQGIQTLERLYLELSNNRLLLKNKTNYSTINSNLEVIRTELSNVFKLYGTENIIIFILFRFLCIIEVFSVI